jgi:hypothetical protein
MPLLSTGNTSLTSSRQQKRNDDAVREKAIMEILEAQKKTWRCINHSSCPPRGGNPLTVQVETPISLTTYDTEESMFNNAMEHLSLQFCLAYTTPVYSSGLLDNRGHLSNTQYALDILEGNYTFPPDTDKWTAKILEEAHHTIALLVDKKIDTTISVSNFQGYGSKLVRLSPHCSVAYILGITRQQVSARIYQRYMQPS